VAPNSGNGYLESVSVGFNPFNLPSSGSSDYIYQPISGSLTAGTSYLFTAYSTDGAVPAAIVVGTGFATALANTTRIYSTGGSGWVKSQQVFTPTTTGSYTLVMGLVSNCVPGLDGIFDVDDVTFGVAPAPCTATVTSVVTDPYNGSTWTGVTIGTTSVSGYNYSWSPGTNLSSTSTSTTVSTYSTISAPEVYSLTVFDNASGCTPATYTVQVNAACPANAGSNVTDPYNGSIWTGVTIGTASVSGLSYAWTPNVNLSSTTTATTTSTYSTITTPEIYTLTVSGTGCAANTSTVQVTAACPANAGPTTTDTNTLCCGCSTAGVKIGTASVSGLSYAWTPNVNLSSTTTATTTSTWCAGTIEHYTLTVSGPGCATKTSTVNVSTIYPGMSCCRIAGIETNTQASGFVVYPNPSNGEFTVSLTDKADYIQVIDVTGRLVFETKDIPAGETKLDLSKYNKGVYFIHVKKGDATEKQKLIVE
jgi:hypothetical protein